MKELKITVDQLKNYLGTGLIMEYSGFGEDKKKLVDKWSISIQEHWDIHFMDEGQTDNDVLFYFKPICYRLSDLDKEIKHNGERFFPVDKIQELYEADLFDWDCKKMWVCGSWTSNTIEWPYSLVKKLFEWNFWLFGDKYFEQGLVIDKMKITKK